MTRQEEKQQLRAIVRRLEAALTPEYKTKSSRAIVRRLLAMPEYQEAQTVFCFVGTRNSQVGADHPQHSCHYTVDEDVLAKGSMVAAQWACRMLSGAKG